MLQRRIHSCGKKKGLQIKQALHHTCDQKGKAQRLHEPYQAIRRAAAQASSRQLAVVRLPSAQRGALRPLRLHLVQRRRQVEGERGLLLLHLLRQVAARRFQLAIAFGSHARTCASWTGPSHASAAGCAGPAPGNGRCQRRRRPTTVHNTRLLRQPVQSLLVVLRQARASGKRGCGTRRKAADQVLNRVNEVVIAQAVLLELCAHRRLAPGA